jgi:hypothetical protein
LSVVLRVNALNIEPENGLRHQDLLKRAGKTGKKPPEATTWSWFALTLVLIDL